MPLFKLKSLPKTTFIADSDNYNNIRVQSWLILKIPIFRVINQVKSEIQIQYSLFSAGTGFKN